MIKTNIECEVSSSNAIKYLKVAKRLIPDELNRTKCTIIVQELIERYWVEGRVQNKESVNLERTGRRESGRLNRCELANNISAFLKEHKTEAEETFLFGSLKVIFYATSHCIVYKFLSSSF